jgi:hypothetical protein
MSRLTSSCFNCGAPKTDFVAERCPNCTTHYTTTMANYRKENPDASDSEVLYAGRTALMQLAHSANRNFLDPRLHSRLGRPAD